VFWHIPADQYAIWSQLIISIDMPHVIRTAAEVSPSVQPVMLSCNNAHWVHLSQNKSHNGMWHVHVVFSDQQASYCTIFTQSTCKKNLKNHTDYGVHKPHLMVYAHNKQVASVY